MSKRGSRIETKGASAAAPPSAPAAPAPPTAPLDVLYGRECPAPLSAALRAAADQRPAPDAQDEGKGRDACQQRFDHGQQFGGEPQLGPPRLRAEMHPAAGGELIGRLAFDAPHRVIAEHGTAVVFVPLAFVSNDEAIAFAGFIEAPASLGAPECMVVFDGRDRQAGERLVDEALRARLDGLPAPLWCQRFRLLAHRHGVGDQATCRIRASVLDPRHSNRDLERVAAEIKARAGASG